MATDIPVHSLRDQSLCPCQAGLFEERAGAFSPDRRLVAFTSNKTGRAEVYLATFPEAGERWRVSADGGGQPVWRRDGAELYHVSPDGLPVAVTVEHSASSTGAAHPLTLVLHASARAER